MRGIGFLFSLMLGVVIAVTPLFCFCAAGVPAARVVKRRAACCGGGAAASVPGRGAEKKACVHCEASSLVKGVAVPQTDVVPPTAVGAVAFPGFVISPAGVGISLLIRRVGELPAARSTSLLRLHCALTV